MTLKIEYLTNLYTDKKYSARDIAKRLEISESQVWYWIKKYHIPIRSRSDANYVKYNPNGDPFTIKSILTTREKCLYYLALGLFWGEGNKRTTIGVRIGNSDPQLIKQWCAFLRSICGVKEEKIKFYLQIFKDMNQTTAVKFWADALSIDVNRIHTAQPLHALGTGSYRRFTKYGVMTVGVFNVRLLRWIMEQLYKLGYNPTL